MTKAADFIAALNQRWRLKTGREASDTQGLPAGWQSWLDTMQPAAKRGLRPDSQSWVAALETHPLQRPGKDKGLTRPFFQLLRLSRPYDPRDERRLRIGATSADILLHLILAGLLLWLMYLQLYAVPLSEEDDGGGSEAVQVEFIGRGNVREGGGALATEGAEAAPAAASSAAAGKPTGSAVVAAASPAAASARPQLEQVMVPPAQLTASQAPNLVQVTPIQDTAAEQPLQVSAVPQPTPDAFRLPPPRELSMPTPAQPREVQLQAQVESITTLRAQPIRTLEVHQPQPQLRPQELRETVRELEVLSPDASRIMRERPLPSTANGTAQLRVPALTGEIRGIPTGTGPGGSSTSAGSGAAALGDSAARGAGGNATQTGGQGQAQAGTGHGTAPGTQGGRGASATGAGAGPGVRAAPGGWPGAARSDDWGASSRNAPGTGTGDGRGGNGNNGAGRGNNGNGQGQPGLFNDDGSVRLPDQWSANSGVDLDRTGSWLKRPGFEYRGTRFDKYWIPSGTLLDEWVRRGIKELSIPIPGTGVSLRCVVSLLQLGGGCLPVNPDVNEQPATGRPAPVIPFKPELQEDNGSVPAPAPVPAPPAAPARKPAPAGTQAAGSGSRQGG